MGAVTARALSWTEAGMVPDTVIRNVTHRAIIGLPWNQWSRAVKRSATS